MRGGLGAASVIATVFVKLKVLPVLALVKRSHKFCKRIYCMSEQLEQRHRCTKVHEIREVHSRSWL